MIHPEDLCGVFTMEGNGNITERKSKLTRLFHCVYGGMLPEIASHSTTQQEALLVLLSLKDDW